MEDPRLAGAGERRGKGVPAGKGWLKVTVTGSEPLTWLLPAAGEAERTRSGGSAAVTWVEAVFEARPGL